MATSAETILTELRSFVRQTATLASIEGVLGWDERTMLPAQGAEHRGEQMATLAGLIHERRTDRRLGDWLGQLEPSRDAWERDADAHPQAADAAATLRELRRQYDRDCKLPAALVVELARAAVQGQHAWQTAREANDFPSFRPHLERMIELKRSVADALGYPEEPYDALLDEFEPGELTSRLSAKLAAVRNELVPLVRAIVDSGRAPDRTLLRRRFPVSAQELFGRSVAEKMGFDFAAGRLDVTAHPFCSGHGPGDCRITTRYDEHFLPSALFGILHEAGHGMYEQGLRAEEFGLPLGESVSLGIHESQSRLWENLVGRSRAFWECFYPQAQKTFGSALADVSLEAFYFAINDVQPSLIRVEADEATYNLHILLRFELERELLRGELQVAELPAAWNARYREYLGVEPPDDAQGVLQDIHWSAGLIGYFPTYTLGNLYACQLFEAAEREVGNLAALFRQGEFQPLLEWLREHVHRQGKRYPAETLIEKATGAAPSHEPLIRYLRHKYGTLYGIA